MSLLVTCACGDLEPRTSSLSCVGCLPSCAANVDPDDLGGTAARIGCDPDLVVEVLPRPGWVSRERQPEVSVELQRSVQDAASGRGCDGPIWLERVGAVGEHPQAVAADVITHASLDSLPLWPRERSCIESHWEVQGKMVRLTPSKPLERFMWYQVRVSQDLALQGAKLCSQLSWRFTVSPCGDGILDAAESFVDWVCLGRVEAERGWFEPYSEECDDGNLTAHDGCSHLCVDETGWTCDDDGCWTRCGDGVRAGTEECDYGIYPPPGCDDQCRIVAGFECNFNGCSPLDPQAAESQSQP